MRTNLSQIAANFSRERACLYADTPCELRILRTLAGLKNQRLLY